MQGAQQLLFPPFRVDLSTERLWQGEREIPLRPKTFAVLRYLLEQREKSVTTAALLQAVWPDVIVSEAVPRMCIHELRCALGDAATHPRFIATHPRRGYRWIAPLTAAPPVVDSRLRVSGLQSAPREPLLGGREAQLAQLHGWLEEAQNGARHIVFITGEPGIGKTTLVEAFLAQVTNGDGLRIVQGQCVEQYGAGEAYLPILEALERLGRVLGPEQLAGTSAARTVLAAHAWSGVDGHQRPGCTGSRVCLCTGVGPVSAAWRGLTDLCCRDRALHVPHRARRCAERARVCGTMLAFSRAGPRSSSLTPGPQGSRE